ncbi:MAG: stage V sporulation protein S [Chloroflexi bacterium]|jgi:stage V sporulation protein S|nr:stage V sporulation protein S [Chloroflexota bacterium]
MSTLRVASHSETTSVAGAVAWRIRDTGSAEIEAIGAGAVNQAVKAVAVARGYLALEGLDLVLVPSFVTVKVGEEERTAMRLLVESRAIAQPAPEEPSHDLLEVASGAGR